MSGPNSPEPSLLLKVRTWLSVTMDHHVVREGFCADNPGDAELTFSLGSECAAIGHKAHAAEAFG
jgi:hypothetical protein